MRTLRAALRLLLVAKLTAFFYLLVLAGRLVAAPGRRARWRAFCFRNWSRSVLAVLGGRVSSRGPAPAPPFLLVANHLSYVDVLVLASRVDGVFIAKSDVAGWPIVGALCRAVGTVFVDRETRRDLPRVMAEIDRLLERGDGVVLFPEGTSSAGAEVGPFLPPLLEVAARSGHPVSWASLGYGTAAGTPPAHLAICWWGDMEFTGHFWELLGHPGFNATLAFGDGSIRERDRKLLAERLRREVTRLFTPVVTGA